MAWMLMIASLCLFTMSAGFFMAAGVEIARMDKSGRQVATAFALLLLIAAMALLFGAGLAMGAA